MRTHLLSTHLILLESWVKFAKRSWDSEQNNADPDDLNKPREKKSY